MKIALQRVAEAAVVSISSWVYAVLLLYTYASFTVPNYGYLGYKWLPQWLTISTGVICITVLSVFLPTRLSRPGDMAIYLLYVVVYIPAMIIPSGYLTNHVNEIILFQIVLTFCIGILLVVNHAPTVHVEWRAVSDSGYSWILIGSFLLLMIPMLVFIGFPTTIPTFASVYVARMDNREAMAAAPGFVAYLSGWLAKVVNPYLVAYGLVHRKVALVIMGTLGTLYLYSLSGAKSTLFTILLIMSIMVGVRICGKYLPLIIMPLLAMMIVASKFLDLVLPTPWFTALLVNRALIVPGNLTGFYLEFFSENPKAQWGYTILSRFVDYPYDSPPAFVIGMEYYQNPATQSNAHIWADGFANFGFGGMALVTVGLGIIVWIINSLSLGRSFLLIVALTLVMSYSLASSSLFTALLTHGVILTILFIALSPTKANSSHSSGAPSVLP